MIGCIIPARGGSKGIPRKNLIPIGGKPLIVWSIEQALAAREVTRVIVATDCDEIARVSADAGAEVYRRSEESATDDAPSEIVLADVINYYSLRAAEAIVFLQATSPIRQPREIDIAVGLFRMRQADSLFSGRHIEGYTWRIRQGRPISDETERLPRQTIEADRIEENGSIYIFKPSILLECGNRLGGRKTVHRMHPLDSFQIDEPGDIPLIEQLLEVRLGHCHAAAN